MCESIPFGYLKLLLEAKSFLFLWINLEIYDLLTLCLYNSILPQSIEPGPYAVYIANNRLKGLADVNSYLHIIFALHQVGQSVKPAHGQHKQRQTHC